MIRIEPMKALHLEAVAKLFIKAFQEAPWNEKWAYESAYGRLSAIYHTDRFIGLIAIEEEKIMGALMGNLEYWHEGNNYNLKELFIDSDCHGKGIGTILLEELNKCLKNESINECLLLTLDASKTRKFYEKNGYHQDQEIIYMKR